MKSKIRKIAILCEIRLIVYLNSLEVLVFAHTYVITALDDILTSILHIEPVFVLTDYSVLMFGMI